MPKDKAHRRYIIDQVFPDGAWYLWCDGESVPVLVGTIGDCLERLHDEENRRIGT
jgi:hypothetical protein